MKKVYLLILIIVIGLLGACTKKNSDSMVLVKGGKFVNSNSRYYDEDITVKDFYIGKYEVTQKEWFDVMGYNPSGFPGDNRPVEMISWYDAVEYCNKRSEKEGLQLYYNIDKETIDPDNISEYDDVKWIVTINEGANGYRLPTEIEWEYAASGGLKSLNYIYSGSNDPDMVAWYWRNAGDEYLTGDWHWTDIENNLNTTKEVATLKPNELGLYDMSGNVREWCEDWYKDENLELGILRSWRGGGWIGDVSCCEISYRGKFEPNGFGADQGLRLVRSK